MCVGDFNDVASILEKEGGRIKERRKIECFKEMTATCSLNEVHSQEQAFTWFGIREGELIKEKMDRVLLNLD